MHRLISAAPKGVHTDHINGIQTDNRRENLRWCTHAQNMRNRKLQRNNTTGARGVEIDMAAGGVKRYRARISVDRKPISLGTYGTIIEASNAYQRAAERYYGEFRRRDSI